MTDRQRIVLVAAFLALAAVVLFPQFERVAEYSGGRERVEALGRHLLLAPPDSTNSRWKVGARADLAVLEAVAVVFVAAAAFVVAGSSWPDRLRAAARAARRRGPHRGRSMAVRRE